MSPGRTPVSARVRKGKRRDPRALGLAHTRRQHAREIAEDYAEAIAELIAERGEARVMDLAGRLGVTHVTVNRTVGRLQKAGIVTTQPYRAILLTGQGRSLAEASRLRHETVVRFLLRLGIPDHIARIDAEGIEHHVSPETLAAFAAALGEGEHRSPPVRQRAIRPADPPGRRGPGGR